MGIFNKVNEYLQSVKANSDADRSLVRNASKDSSSNSKGATIVEYSCDQLIKIIEGFVDKYRDPSIDGYIKFLISFYSIFSLKKISNDFQTLEQYDRTDQLREYLKEIGVNIYDLTRYKREILECCIDFEKPNHTPDYSNCISLQIIEFCIKQLDALIPKESTVRIPYCTIPSYALYNEKGYKFTPDYAGNHRYEDIGKVITQNIQDTPVLERVRTVVTQFIPPETAKIFGISYEEEKYGASILILPTIYGKKLTKGKSEEDIINDELNKLNEHSGTLLVILPYDWLKKENKDKHKRLQLLPKKVVSLPYQVNDKPIAWLCFQKNNDAQTLLYDASLLKGDNIVDKLLRLVRTKGPEYKENEGLDPGTIVTFSIDEFTTRFSEQFDNDKKPHYIIHPYHLSESYSSCDINFKDIDQKPSNNDKLHRLEPDSFVIVKSKNTGKVRIGYIPDRRLELYIEENDYVNFKIKKDGHIQKDYLLNKIFTALKSAEGSMETAFNAIRLVDLPAIRQLENVLELERIEKKESDKQYEAKIREEYEKYKRDVKTKKHNLAQYIAKIVPAIGTMDCLLETLKIEDDNIKETMRSLRYYSDLVSASIDGFNDFEEIGTIMEFNLHDVVDDFIKVRGYDYIEKSWEYESEECISKRIRFSKSTLNNILSNIYQNVVDHAGFSQTDENKGKICCSLSLIENKLVLEIKNNGKPIEGSLGFSPDSKTTESIFTEGTTTKTDKDGHGIGCYYMKKCLEHKDEKGNPYGSIDIVSTPNEVFKVKYVITFNQVK